MKSSSNTTQTIRFRYLSSGFVAFLFSMLFLACGSGKEPDNNQSAPVSGRIDSLYPEFQQILDSHQLKGSILIARVEDSLYLSNDPKRTWNRYLPASTFKIINSIIALETGVVEDDSTLFPWNGEKRRLPVWEQDLIFRQAFHYSCVPCYQQIARKIGPVRMRHYLDTLRYGKMVVDSSSIDVFWLEGTSGISQQEQVGFLHRFYEKQLPVSEHTYEVMKRMMVIDTLPNGVLSGKSGWVIRNGTDIGWFVGYYETENAVWYLATNVEPLPGRDMEDFPSVRLQVTREALRMLGL